MLYLVYAESANYCGYGQHFVVEAEYEVEAEELVYPESEGYFYEQDAQQLEEEGIDEGSYSHIKTIEEFDETHYYWKLYQDPSRSELYIKVNF